MLDPKLDELVRGLQQSKKYRTVCDATLNRIAQWALDRYPQPKLALKMAKNKLHQVYGAYLEGIAAGRVLEQLQNTTVHTVRDVCQRVLESHASTRERLPFLDRLYPAIFEITGTPTHIHDLACGLHPFALPWMNLPSAARYVPSDIDTRLCGLHNAILRALHMPELAQCDDILVPRDREPADLTFLLKTLPCLDQQENHAADRVLARLRTTWLVVSFPTQSLGGRRKGMHDHYATHYEPLLTTHAGIAAKLDFPNELFYILKMHHPQ